MTSKLELRPHSTLLLVIDVQEKLCAAMPDAGEPCIRNVDRLLEGARLLGLPVMVSEQYPKGLGHTVPALRDRIARFESPPAIFEKLEFAATANPAFADALDRSVADGVSSVIVSGMEAHICVYQTVRGLRSKGLSVHVAIDATASRTSSNLDVGRELWRDCGAHVSSVETVLFDLLGKAGGDTFKEISRLIR